MRRKKTEWNEMKYLNTNQSSRDARLFIFITVQYNWIHKHVCYYLFYVPERKKIWSLQYSFFLFKWKQAVWTIEGERKKWLFEISKGRLRNMQVHYNNHWYISAGSLEHIEQKLLLLLLIFIIPSYAVYLFVYWFVFNSLTQCIKLKRMRLNS